MSKVNLLNIDLMTDTEHQKHPRQKHWGRSVFSINSALDVHTKFWRCKPCKPPNPEYHVSPEIFVRSKQTQPATKHTTEN